MNGSHYFRSLLIAYSVLMLALPLAPYSTISDFGVPDAELSIASVYDATSQPLFWKQSDTLAKNCADCAQSLHEAGAFLPGCLAPGLWSPQVDSFRLASSLALIHLPSWRGLIHYRMPPPFLQPV